MDLQSLTIAHLRKQERRAFDPSDENAYYESAGGVSWPVWLAVITARLRAAVLLLRLQSRAWRDQRRREGEASTG